MVIGVIAMQVFRFFYFSTVWFKDVFDNPSAKTHCAVSWTTNLPVTLEVIIIIIVHEFFFRLYMQMISKFEKYRGYMRCFKNLCLLLYIVFFIIDSVIGCYNYGGEYTRALKINSLIEAALVLIFNPIYVIPVLRAFHKNRIGELGSEGRSIFRKVALLGVLFEIAYIVRVVLIVKQDYWKQHNVTLYNIFFTIYIVIGEICCQMVLIVAIIVYTNRMR